MSETQTMTREEQAQREVGHTTIGRGAAVFAVGVFLAVLVAIPLAEIAAELRGDAASPWSELLPARHDGPDPRPVHRQWLARFEAFEDALDKSSVVAEKAGPWVQWTLTRHFAVGNEQVVVGAKDWLFFRPALDYLTGPGFLDPRAVARRAAAGDASQPALHADPVPAIADFARQLAERGIGLVVVVTPVKAALHPEALAPQLDGADLPLENPSLATFVERLAEREIPAYSPANRLADLRRTKPWPLFLRTDTHWTPQAVEESAQGLADFIKRHVALPERPEVELTRAAVGVSGRGDLARLLLLPEKEPLFQPETVLAHPVRGAEGQPWHPDPEADVLVLGDSFTNIYSEGEPWGEGAGFAEQLAFALRRPVDRLAVNGGGPSATRERLAASVAAGKDRLAGKRLVVYQFSARELTAGDWKPVELAPQSSRGVAGPPPRPKGGVPARGFITWESNRTGDWRIWMRRLEGSPPSQLSPDEPERQHCCAHISPDGSRLVYLSRLVPRDEYPELEIAGELRLVSLPEGNARVVNDDARPYGWGNRGALWHDDTHVAYIRGDGRTFLLDVESGDSSLLMKEPRTKLAWLVNARLEYAVNGSPRFSAYDAEARGVRDAERRSGCEPYFTHDGRYGFWVASGGGPIRWVELGTGRTGRLLDKNDTRIPGEQRYAYFPMLSRDGRMLAFGASRGDHNHFWSNYDLFVAPTDPGTLELLGRPLRLTAHPASDRYPDVHVEGLELDEWRGRFPPVPLETAAPLPDAVPIGPKRVRATLKACSAAPSLREISPYDAALVVCEWDVVETLEGEKTNRVRVAHWAWRDRERQAIVATMAGSSRVLDVEPLRGLSQIEGYPLFDTLRVAPGLPLYYTER